jgi:hypothetical protein
LWNTVSAPASRSEAESSRIQIIKRTAETSQRRGVTEQSEYSTIRRADRSFF